MRVLKAQQIDNYLSTHYLYKGTHARSSYVGRQQVCEQAAGRRDHERGVRLSIARYNVALADLVQAPMQGNAVARVGLLVGVVGPISFPPTEYAPAHPHVHTFPHAHSSPTRPLHPCRHPFGTLRSKDDRNKKIMIAVAAGVAVIGAALLGYRTVQVTFSQNILWLSTPTPLASSPPLATGCALHPALFGRTIAVLSLHATTCS